VSSGPARLAAFLAELAEDPEPDDYRRRRRRSAGPLDGDFVTTVQTSRTTAYVIYYCIFRRDHAVFVARIERQGVVRG
jgi:hypothetical protein